MSETRDFLAQREKALLKKREAALSAVDDVDAELAEVRRAYAALNKPDEPALLRLAAGLPASPSEPYENWTLKQLAVRALLDHFPYGATANQLLAVFKSAYGREIARESLSPQLSRLKEADLIVLDGKLWKVAPRAKNATDTVSSRGFY